MDSARAVLGNLSLVAPRDGRTRTPRPRVGFALMVVVAGLVALLAGAGCSLLVNTGGLDTEPAASDSSVPVDAGHKHDTGSTHDAERGTDGGHLHDASGGHADAGHTPDGGLDAPVDAGSPALAIDEGFPIIVSLPTSTLQAVLTTFSTPADRLLVAVVVWGQYAGAGVWPVTVDGAGLTWSNPVQTVSDPGFPDAVGVGIWVAYTDKALTMQTLTATRSNDPAADVLLAIYSLSGASPTVGATGLTNAFMNGTAQVAITVEAEAAGSMILGGMLDADPNLGGSALPNTTYDALLASSSGCGLGIPRLMGVTTEPGGVTIGQDASSGDLVAAAIEILQR